MRRLSTRIPTKAPSPEQLGEIADSLGLELPSNQLVEYQGLVQSFLSAFRQVDDLSLSIDVKHQRRQPPLSRTFWKPEPNPGNAWVTRCEISNPEYAIKTLPLTGKRVAIKDVISVAGLPMTCGSGMLTASVPDCDATVVKRVLRAGASILGKAACEEFCFSGGSHTGYPGVVPNPHDPRRSAGGSSSGCAYLLANGDVDLALGTDQGGSARTPAAWCGVVGLKPTFGLVPYTGVVSMCRRLDHVGLMARTVDDVGKLLAVLAGPDGLDCRQEVASGVQDLAAASQLTGDLGQYRFALLAEGFFAKDAELDATVRAAAQKIFQASGGKGGECPVVSVPRHRRAHRFVSCLSLLEGFEERRRSSPNQQPRLPSRWPTNTAASLAAASLDADCRTELIDACIDLVDLLRNEYDNSTDSIDFLLMPTLPYRPPLLPSPGIESTFSAAFGMMGNTQPFCATGHPGVSVNCGTLRTPDGRELPVGLMLVAGRFNDFRLIDAALGVERLLGRFFKSD